MKRVAISGIALLAALTACGTSARSVSRSQERTSSPSPPAATTALTSTPPARPTPTPTPSLSPTSRGPRFRGSSAPIDAATRSTMVSWHQGCPVPIEDLRLLSMSYWGFDGAMHNGQMIVNQDMASDVTHVFHVLFDDRSPVRRMQLVDAYGGDDDRSMAADNTSGFNCRVVPGSTTWSQHAYGRAIDINPLENPWVSGGMVLPPSGAPYVDRSLEAKGMIHPGDVVVLAFRSVGWSWGGDWRSLKDYQHFSRNGL